MPKTRRSRKKKTKNQATGEDGKTRSGADSDSKVSKVTVDIEHKSEVELKSYLKEELIRLQDEYQRQKLITQELERERNKLGELGPEGLEGTATASAVATEHQPKMQQYPEVEPIEHAPSFEDEYLSEPRIDRELMESISSLENELGEIKAKLDSKLDKSAISELDVFETMNRELTNKITSLDNEVQRMRKEVEKTDQKLSDILLDLGFEESIDINKIPYNILVLVYETILDDIITKIRHIKGVHDTEVIVNNILENIRSHTSGGELFKYEHNKITIPQLRQYLAKKLISPKQIHITYNSILQQLLEHAPRHTPKNFKAMIKVLSQEYAVDATSKLEEMLKSYNNEMEELKENINKFFAKYKDRAVSQQFFKDELKNVNIHITKITERIDKLPEIINDIVNKMVAERVGGLDKASAVAPPKKDEDEKDEEALEEDKKLELEDKTESTIESKPEAEPEGEKHEGELKQKHDTVDEPQAKGVFGGSGTIVLGDEEPQELSKDEEPVVNGESAKEEPEKVKSDDDQSISGDLETVEKKDTGDEELDMASIKEKIAEMVKQKGKPQMKEDKDKGETPTEDKQQEKGKFQSIVIDDESSKPLEDKETKSKEKKQKSESKKTKEKIKEKAKSKIKSDDEGTSESE